MNVGARFILDAGILPYSADRDAGDRQDRARDPVGRAAKRDCVLTIQAGFRQYFQYFRSFLREVSSVAWPKSG